MMSLNMFLLFGMVVISFIMFNIVIVSRGNLRFLHKLYITNSTLTVIWFLSLMSLRFYHGNITAEYIIDSMTNIFLFAPALMVVLALTFVNSWETFPRWCWIIFVFPAASFLLIWTNPLHHLFYEVFSLKREVVRFGPLFYISSFYARLVKIY